MNRIPQYPIDDLFLRRWSPRAMSGEPMSDKELFTLLEAGRWAPSSRNDQPWKFIYAKRDTPCWDSFLDLLSLGNKKWCINASALVIICYRKVFEKDKSPNKTAAFSCGSAFENIALQATINGLVVHPMEGFDYEKAKIELSVPSDHEPIVMFAAGKPGRIEDLDESFRTRESPSDRKKLAEIILEGKF